jgi:hypothetical protein
VAHDLLPILQGISPSEGIGMRVHGPQLNPYAQIDALRSAQRAAAKREAEIVRKELLDYGSELVADSDFSDLSVTAERREPRKQPRQRKKQNPDDQQTRTSTEPAASEDAFNHISDWA